MQLLHDDCIMTSEKVNQIQRSTNMIETASCHTEQHCEIKHGTGTQAETA